MTVAEELERILAETIAALPRLQPEELEDLEKRASALVELSGRGSVAATPGLRAKVGTLRNGLAATSVNLTVLRRILNKEEAAPWVA